MSIELDRLCRATGTRFRLFPQPSFLEPLRDPETVWVSPPAGAIGPGPSDDRMYVVDPIGKPQPYGPARRLYGPPFLYLPPWEGPVRPPAMPDRDGHFDHLEPGAPEFEAAHAYGIARRVLEIWEDYLGRPIDWHFGDDLERLEIVLLPPLQNATAGYGFIELGSEARRGDGVHLFSLNFDIIAHEMGHLILYSELGRPNLATPEGEFFGFHECGADLIALISTLHFDSVVDRLLATTRGNLYTFNELNRFAELSANQQIRLAGNSTKLSDFASGWTSEHDLSEPLTGAIFDVLVDVFHDKLVRQGIIGAETEALMDELEQRNELGVVIQEVFDRAYARNHEPFRQALLEARDHIAINLAEVWRRLSPDRLRYAAVGDILLELDLEMTGGRHRNDIRSNFRWRDIGFVAVGPRLIGPDETSHAFSSRTMTPADPTPTPERPGGLLRLPYRERWIAARSRRAPSR